MRARARRSFHRFISISPTALFPASPPILQNRDNERRGREPVCRSQRMRRAALRCAALADLPISWRRPGPGQGNNRQTQGAAGTPTPTKDGGRQQSAATPPPNAWATKGKPAGPGQPATATAASAPAEHHVPVRGFNANEVKDFLKKSRCSDVATRRAVALTVSRLPRQRCRYLPTPYPAACMHPERQLIVRQITSRYTTKSRAIRSQRGAAARGALEVFPPTPQRLSI
jgi:hypothetical protein